ncbi:TetR/AcrR family transcriptional regulator [Streptomyces sp. NPDC014894]|uniref:TetR/AcrR family transcriptional regulator n=1 Tax=unclassified Streptomyces TaxID=2593676 RepID=UPI003701DF22
MASAADRAKGPARTSVWLAGGADRTRRAAQPAGLDRDKIIEATVRLLDAEGTAKFSMRRLAAELDVTAMSVYWYVDTKDELLELALDAAFASLAPPDVSVAEQWREQLRALAVAYREMLVRHPWVSAMAGAYLNVGPNSLAFSTAVQQVMRNTGLPTRGQMGGLSAVFQFVYGFGTIEGHFIARCAAAGLTQDEYLRDALGTMTGDPSLEHFISDSTDFMEEQSRETVEENRQRDFDYALELLVAGIEAMVARG